MNLHDIAHCNVQELVYDSTQQMYIEDFDEFNNRVVSGWEVLDICKFASFYQPGLDHFHHIPYRRPELVSEWPDMEEDLNRMTLLHDADFAREFQALFGNYESVKLILLEADRCIISDAIEGLLEHLGPRKDIQLATYVPLDGDFPDTKGSRYRPVNRRKRFRAFLKNRLQKNAGPSFGKS